MKKKVAVIGAGIAGLSAGCYLQKFGFETEIFEAQPKAGGLCSWWNRQGFTVDGCIHWIVGVQPTVEFYPIWKDIIPIDELDIHYFDEFCRVIDSEGNSFHAFNDIKKLEKEMLRVAPKDKKQIRRFIRYLRRFENMTVPVLKPMKLMSLREKVIFALKILTRIRLFFKLSRMRCSEFAKKFRSPLLQRFFSISYIPFYPLIAAVYNINWLAKKGAGYPIGGSQKLIEMIVEEFKNAGGKINYNSLVEKIIIENKHAKGLVTTKGEVQFFDYVVSTGDGQEALLKLVGEEHLDRKMRKWFVNPDIDAQSSLYISIGLEGKAFKHKGHRYFFPYKEPIKIQKGHEITELDVTVYDFNPTATPENHTLLTIMLNPGDQNYWIELRKNNHVLYNEEKKRIIDEVIDRLEKQFGELRNKIVFTDLATPATYKRYTRNQKGAIQGWDVTPKEFLKIVPKTVRGLKRFYMTGQWIENFGGLPNGLMGGRHVAQLIVHDLNKRKN